MTFSKSRAIPVLHLLWTMGLLLLVMLSAESVSAQSDREIQDGFLESLREKQILLENLEHVKKIKDQMDQLFGQGFNFTLISDSLMSNSSDLQVNKRCLDDILLVASMMLHENTSALQMLDAWGKPADGLMNMKLSYMGSYDECLKTRIPATKGQIKGKYCSASITLGGGNSTTTIGTSMMGILLGTCFPSSCNEDDVQSLLSTVIPTVVVPVCATDDPLPWKSDEIVALIVISVIALLVVVGTVVDGYVRLVKNRRSNSIILQESKPQGLTSRVLLCFSAYSNTKKIFDVSNTQGTLGVLHGMRFFSISWVVLCHSYLSVNLQLPVNLMVIQDMIDELGFEIITSGTLSVDTFFFMSGFLVAYVALPQLMKLREKNQRFNIFGFYFHRYWRLTPPLALVIALSIFWSRLGSGPLWNRDAMTESCRNYWWSNLIYINNFYEPGLANMCIAQSWYLANDFQFYLISPLFLLLLVRHELLGILVTSLFILESVICNGVITVVKHYPPTTFILPALTIGNHLKPFEDVYIKPYTRIGPYCVGITAGYVIRRYPKLRFSLITQLTGWLATGAVLLAVIFIPYEWNKGTAYTDVEAFFYSSLHRLLWSIGIAWIVIMCATRQGGIIDEFLSWKAFVPLSRLSYMVFLVHPSIVAMFYSSSKVQVDYSNYNVIHWFLSFIVLSYALAYVCALGFEAPFVGIEKIIFRRPSKSPAESSAKEDFHPTKREEDCERLTEDPEGETAETDNTGFAERCINTNNV